MVCALVVRRVRSAMADEEEEEEEEAAAATPSLREQGNIHNASFTAGKKPAAIFCQAIKEQI